MAFERSMRSGWVPYQQSLPHAADGCLLAPFSARLLTGFGRVEPQADDTVVRWLIANCADTRECLKGGLQELGWRMDYGTVRPRTAISAFDGEG